MVRWLAVFLLFPVLASAQEGFQLPSGNIHCMTFEGSIRCDVLQSTYPRPPRPLGCDLEYGDAVEVAPSGAARLVCHGDTVADPALPVLGYGRAWRGRGMSCTASQAGLRCVNAEGRGFELSRARMLVF